MSGSRGDLHTLLSLPLLPSHAPRRTAHDARAALETRMRRRRGSSGEIQLDRVVVTHPSSPPTSPSSSLARAVGPCRPQTRRVSLEAEDPSSHHPRLRWLAVVHDGGTAARASERSRRCHHADPGRGAQSPPLSSPFRRRPRAPLVQSSHRYPRIAVLPPNPIAAGCEPDLHVLQLHGRASGDGTSGTYRALP